MSQHEPLDPLALRIVDANMNRAREALRVLEEYARFGLEDAGLAGTAKSLRHGLVNSVPRDLADLLVARRDIVGDVGRDVRTTSEYHRGEVSDVVRAAAHRLSEALRSIEEYGKTIDAGFAATIEQLRYGGYELARRIERCIDARTRFAHVRLYVLLTESLCAGDWLATAEAAIRGGADCLQLREKNLSDRALLTRGKTLAALCRAHNRCFVVNDRPDIAAAVGADGVHLGQDDLPVAEARRLLPAHALVGVSTHTLAQIERAAVETPDYIAVGPMFGTSTKPQDHIAGPVTLASARKITSLPLVAIGGINEGNASEVLAAAPCALAICQAVISQPDVAASAAHLRSLFETAD